MAYLGTRGNVYNSPEPRFRYLMMLSYVISVLSLDYLVYIMHHIVVIIIIILTFNHSCIISDHTYHGQVSPWTVEVCHFRYPESISSDELM